MMIGASGSTKYGPGLKSIDRYSDSEGMISKVPSTAHPQVSHSCGAGMKVTPR